MCVYHLDPHPMQHKVALMTMLVCWVCNNMIRREKLRQQSKCVGSDDFLLLFYY